MKFYANPYNPNAVGFYFESTEEFEEKSAELKDEFGIPVEEFEVEAIDGTREEMELADLLGINQANIADFIDFIEDSYEDLWPTISFILDGRANTLDRAVALTRDYCVVESSLLGAASELFDEYYGHSIPEELRIYIDHEKFAADLKYSGELVEFEFGGKTYTCTNANQ